jgi:hypothetical protein
MLDAGVSFAVCVMIWPAESLKKTEDGFDDQE